jgi:hypothetical protein
MSFSRRSVSRVVGLKKRAPRGNRRPGTELRDQHTRRPCVLAPEGLSPQSTPLGEVSPSPTPLASIREILLPDTAAQEEAYATWLHGEPQSQTRSVGLAVSLVRDRSSRQRSLRQEDCCTVEHYPDEAAMRRAVVGLLSEINPDVRIPQTSRVLERSTRFPSCL